MKVENGTTYELGYRWILPSFLTTISLFNRTGSDLIDWVMYDGDTLWTARNIAAINTSGVELSIKMFPQNLINRLPITAARIGYVFLRADREPDGFKSKYVFNHFTHQAIIHVNHNLLFGFKQTWVLRYEDPQNTGNRFLVDTRLEREIKMVNVYLNVTNVFDVKYTDLTSVPMPGRWVRGGFFLTSLKKSMMLLKKYFVPE